jgi:hypothetical protein
MDRHLENWRRRLSLHAATVFLLFGVLLAFRFMVELDSPTPPSDDVLHRWRMAHLEGLTRSFVLFGLAASLGFFRLPRSTITFACTVIIAATWAAVIGAVLTAEWGQHGRGAWTPEGLANPSTELLQHRIVFIIAAAATIGTIVAFLLIFIRAAWEGLREGIFPRSWHNWAKIVSIRPRRVAEPTTCEELEDCLRDAFDANMPVHAFGARASWNGIATSHGVMVSMEGLDRVLHLNTAKKKVRVEAGIEIGALSRHLHDRGYALETTPVIPWVQVGGALGTCSHGTGIHHEQFSELVVEMEIFHDLNGQPDLLRVTKGVDDNQWNALLTNLGAMGVVYSVTLEIIEDFNVRFRDIAMPMRQTIDDKLRDLLYEEVDTGIEQEKIYSEILWYPYNDDCIVKQWYPTDEDAPSREFQDLWVDFVQFLQTRLLTPALHFVLSLFPWVTPIVMRLIHDVALREDAVMPLYQGLQYIRRYPRVVAMSYGIPFDPSKKDHGMDEVRKAWFAAVDRIDALEHDGIYPVNMVLHARFVKNGHSSLNPAWSQIGKEGYTCHIEVLTAENTPRYEEFFEDLERQWMLMDGRPHWGKLCFAPEQIRDTIDPANLANWEEWRRIMDPRALFMNDYLRRILRVPE